MHAFVTCINSEQRYKPQFADFASLQAYDRNACCTAGPSQAYGIRATVGAGA